MFKLLSSPGAFLWLQVRALKSLHIVLYYVGRPS